MKNSFIVKGFDFYNTYLKARLGLQEELNTDTNYCSIRWKYGIQIFICSFKK